MNGSQRVWVTSQKRLNVHTGIGTYGNPDCFAAWMLERRDLIALTV